MGEALLSSTLPVELGVPGAAEGLWRAGPRRHTPPRGVGQPKVCHTGGHELQPTDRESPGTTCQADTPLPKGPSQAEHRIPLTRPRLGFESSAIVDKGCC